MDLRGPDDPNGPVYALRRPDDSRPQTHMPLIPGASTVAPLTHLLAKPGSAGAPGSVGWEPTHLVVTPPGDSGTLSVAWSSTDPMLREDPAEHPATFVGAFTHV